MNGFRFHDPLWLGALLPALLLLWLAARRGRTQAVTFSSVADLASLPITLAQRLKPLLPLLRVAGVVLLVIALARPQHGREETRIRTEGIDIMMVIDRSGSMEALDFQDETSQEPVNRLHVVKQVFRRFVAGEGAYEGRKDDQVGLVAFAGYAENRCPLTLDHGALLQILDTVKIPGADLDQREYSLAREFVQEESATAIGDALALGVNGLKDAKAKSRIVILLSDGESNAGVLTPEQAADIAVAAGVKVYTIGIGSTGAAPFPFRDTFGRQYVQARMVTLDESTLRAIAEKTHGRYFSARDTDALEQVVASIDELERTPTEGVVYTDYRELFFWALLPGIALLLGEVLLSATRFLSLP